MLLCRPVCEPLSLRRRRDPRGRSSTPHPGNAANADAAGVPERRRWPCGCPVVLGEPSTQRGPLGPWPAAGHSRRSPPPPRLSICSSGSTLSSLLTHAPCLDFSRRAGFLRVPKLRLCFMVPSGLRLQGTAGPSPPGLREGDTEGPRGPCSICRRDFHFLLMGRVSRASGQDAPKTPPGITHAWLARIWRCLRAGLPEARGAGPLGVHTF